MTGHESTPDSARDAPPFDLRAVIATYLGAANPDVALLHLTLHQIGKMVEAPGRQLLADDGLETSERSVLVALLFSGPGHAMTPTQLSTAIVQTTSGMSKTLRRLERAGMVASEPDPQDGRGRLIRLSDSGVDLARHHLVTLTDYWQERFAGRDPKQLAQLADAAWTLLALVDPTFDPGPPPKRANS